MAKFDFDDVFNQMHDAFKKQAGDSWKKVKSVSEEFSTSNKERLSLIAELALTGELTQEEFRERLEDEKLMLEAQLNALKVISKAAVQKAVNSVFDILENAVVALIP